MAGCAPWERRWEKNTRPGGGPKPHSSGRGVITLWKERCCLRSSTIGGRGPSCPPVTSGGQKTGCANRGLRVWTTGESTLSAGLGGPLRRIPRRAAWVYLGRYRLTIQEQVEVSLRPPDVLGGLGATGPSTIVCGTIGEDYSVVNGPCRHSVHAAPAHLELF